MPYGSTTAIKNTLFLPVTCRFVMHWLHNRVRLSTTCIRLRVGTTCIRLRVGTTCGDYVWRVRVRKHTLHRTLHRPTSTAQISAFQLFSVSAFTPEVTPLVCSRRSRAAGSSVTSTFCGSTFEILRFDRRLAHARQRNAKSSRSGNRPRLVPRNTRNTAWMPVTDDASGVSTRRQIVQPPVSV